MPRKTSNGGSQPTTPQSGVPESPRAMNKQAKLQRLLKQLHGQSTLPENLITANGSVGPELRRGGAGDSTDMPPPPPMPPQSAAGSSKQHEEAAGTPSLSLIHI